MDEGALPEGSNPLGDAYVWVFRKYVGIGPCAALSQAHHVAIDECIGNEIKSYRRTFPVGVEARLPLTRLASVHANDLGGAEGVEAVHEGDADMDFGGLAVGVSGGDAFAE